MRAILLFLLLSMAASAQPTFCAIHLWVVNESDRPETSAQVQVMDPNGKKVLETFVEKGRADICNLEFGQHTVRITNNWSLGIIIENVEVEPDVEQTIKATLNSRLPGRSASSGGNACILQFRVLSSSGQPIEAAQITGETFNHRTSKNGFSRGLLRLGIKETVQVQAEGFLPDAVEVECYKRDRAVIMLRPTRTTK